ncbi:hypothetical protein Pan44_23180 [Caulifigura coniformis]|uniref:Uncharacterized protein n=1 Tax=Caulifigura coniformis TaxID=2527983 RepID=A0A517SDU1_9PLAN|nr:hypothetical protein [Caulifigura coniformis]QDT54290.1 hypothetical protein Pan44_23180 [Caulifigura coniformis]
MIFYHRTHAADAILAKGFRNGLATYATGRPFSGVWLSDVPLGYGQGLAWDFDMETSQLLTVEMPLELVAKYEWVEILTPKQEAIYGGIPRGYREWLIPAKLVNRFAVKLIPEPELV